MKSGWCFLESVSVMASAARWAAEPIFVPVKVDGPAHDPANHTCWYGPFSECASAPDGDGDLDIAAGRNWYEAPPNFAVSVGMKLNIADMDRDGENDIANAGKGGLYIFYDVGFPPSLKEPPTV